MREKGFKQLKGIRIMLSIPRREESKIKLPTELQEEADRDFALQLTKLQIYAIGDNVEGYDVGDVVNVPTDALRRGRFIEINGEQKLIINSLDIDLIW